MKTPAQIAGDLRLIVSRACSLGPIWRDEPIAASELAGVYAETSAYLLAEREKAIANELLPHTADCECDTCAEAVEELEGGER